MLIDGLVFAEGSTVVNLTVPFGTAFPVLPNTGELFYKTSDSTLYVYTGATWSGTGSSGAGGGVTVGGADTQVQYNDAGVLAGSASFTFDSSTGTLTATNLVGSGVGLTDLDAANIASGLIDLTRLGTGTPDSGTYLRGDGVWAAPTGSGVAAAGAAQQIQYNDGANGLAASADLTFNPTTSMLFAENISGSGTNIADLDANNLLFGTVPTARLGSGTADASVFLRGDGTWSSVLTSGSVAGNDTEVQFNSLGSLSSSADFTFAASTGTLSALNFVGAGGNLTNLNASNLASGTVGTARLGSGTASSSTYLRGDGTWAAVSLSSTNLTDGAFIAKTNATTSISGAWTFTSPVAGVTPTSGADFATKTYVDSIASGLKPHASVEAATTANITLSGTQTVDGVALVAGNRVLVKNQTTASQNGIYVVASGAWTRAADFDGVGEVNSGDFVFVEGGTLNAASGWVVLTTGTITVGTTAIEFSKVSSSANGGTVTSVTVSGGATGLTTSGGPITSTGTITLGGTLSVANGGTGNTATPSLGAVTYGDGSKIAYSTVGTAGQFLMSTGAGAPSWSTSGSTLTGLNASNLASGTVGTARLGSGTASSSTYLRGDGTWAAVSPTQLTGTTNFGSPTATTTGLYAGLTLGSNNLPGIQFNAGSATTDQKIWMLYSHTDGSFNLSTFNDSRASGVIPFKISRSGTAISTIALSSAAIDLIIGTGGLKLNGAAGTAGQVLMSNGASAAPTWGSPTVSTLSATAAMPAISARGVFGGVRSSFPTLRFYQSSATATNQYLNEYLDASGGYNLAFDNDTTSVAFLSATRSGATATQISLTGTAINLAVGTGGLKLNGAAGSAGQVLMSNGASAAPTWSSVSVNALSGTGSITASGTTTGLYAGVATSAPVLYMTHGGATTGNRAMRGTVTSSGEFKLTFLPDNLASETSFFSATRSGTTATQITLTGTAINLAVGTGGLKLNGSAGTAGQVLVSNGASAAPTWGTASANASALSGTTLASTVVSSSLTSVGTLGTLTVTGATSVGALTATSTASITGNTTVGGTLTVTGQLTSNGVLEFGKAYIEKSTNTTATATTNFDCSVGNIFNVTLSANITSITFSNIPVTGKAYSMTLFVTQDSTGGRTITWPAALKWPSGSSPTLTSAATKTDVFTLITHDGGTTWFGFVAGQNF